LYKKRSELFQVLFDQKGVGFSRKEMDATLSLCSGLSFMSPRPNYTDDEFADLVKHIDMILKSEGRIHYQKGSCRNRNQSFSTRKPTYINPR
jgi:hypothetical protein